ncbi:hypothetical protein [Alistipes sp.]|mgnify:FL=1|uniref:hypothetical protein n=1 Tax=Alistipes sp. TaxID=1872444 RepID=UPI00307CED31
MEKSDAIRRAVRQVPAPELPADFTPRLMERMRREAARRERRETWLLTAGGIGCFTALISACVTALWPDFRLRIPDFALPRPELLHIGLPHIELPHIALPEEDKSLVAMCVCIALAFLVLLLADLMIRRRIASSRN